MAANRFCAIVLVGAYHNNSVKEPKTKGIIQRKYTNDFMVHSIHFSLIFPHTQHSSYFLFLIFSLLINCSGYFLQFVKYTFVSRYFFIKELREAQIVKNILEDSFIKCGEICFFLNRPGFSQE